MTDRKSIIEEEVEIASANWAAMKARLAEKQEYPESMLIQEPEKKPEVPKKGRTPSKK